MIKLLSKQAKQFILELKMYLLSKGKREKEINEIIVELKDHLLEAELEGKSIKDITGGSPQIYMKSISQEMGVDARQILSLAPMSALLIMAFICFTLSIRGDFSLSKIGVWGVIIGTIFSLALYGFLLARVLPKVFYSKWFSFIIGMSYIILTGFFVLVFLFDKDPFFVATPLQNTLILLGCITVFVIWVLYAKSWLTVIVPFFMSLGPLAERFLSTEINEDPFYITLAIILGIPVMIGILYFMFRKRSAE